LHFLKLKPGETAVFKIAVSRAGISELSRFLINTKRIQKKSGEVAAVIKNKEENPAAIGTAPFFFGSFTIKNT
jgi:hypothetical protein